LSRHFIKEDINGQETHEKMFNLLSCYHKLFLCSHWVELQASSTKSQSWWDCKGAANTLENEQFPEVDRTPAK
jgi:hypothetical protein